jgi:hypothetical protein
MTAAQLIGNTNADPIDLIKRKACRLALVLDQFAGRLERLLRRYVKWKTWASDYGFRDVAIFPR